MTKKEFILGMSIISVCVIGGMLINLLPMTSTIDVKVTKVETVTAKTDTEGNVEVIVND